MTKKSTGTAVGSVKADALPDLAGLAKGLRHTRQRMPSTGGKPYLKFGKDGSWELGKNGDSFTDELAVLNPTTLKSGFVCWTDYDKDTLKKKKKNEKLGDEMELITRGGVSYDDLPDTGWDWKTQMSVEGRMLHGDQKDFTYTTSSMGGLDFFGLVLDAVDERIEDGEGVFLFPVVRLGSDWYDHATWGKTYKPEVEIVSWADVNGELETDIEESEPEEEEPEEEPVKPKRRKTAKKPEPEPEPEKEPEEDTDPEPEDEPEEEEPPRRRRRR